VVRSAYPLQNP
jgi:hypothetical protein